MGKARYAAPTRRYNVLFPPLVGQNGTPPPAPKARTGEDTPPGSTNASPVDEVRGCRCYESSFSQPATSLAQYVTTMSAPARRTEVSTSRTAARRSTAPAAAAASTMAYSPETT